MLNRRTSDEKLSLSWRYFERVCKLKQFSQSVLKFRVSVHQKWCSSFLLMVTHHSMSMFEKYLSIGVGMVVSKWTLASTSNENTLSKLRPPPGHRRQRRSRAHHPPPLTGIYLLVETRRLVKPLPLKPPTAGRHLPWVLFGTKVINFVRLCRDLPPSHKQQHWYEHQATSWQMLTLMYLN